eukprot:scaffold61018_cov52-Cyclotella_meneghiniana.AAC.9
MCTKPSRNRTQTIIYNSNYLANKSTKDVNDCRESEESWDEGNDHLIAWVGTSHNPLTSIKMKKYLLKVFDEGEKMNQIMRDNGLIAFGDGVNVDKDDRRAPVEK